MRTETAERLSAESSPSVAKFQLWVQSINYQRLLWNALQICVVVCTVAMVSGLSVRLLYRRYVPQPLLKEKLYFDFRLSEPSANLKLNNAPVQWNYIGVLASATYPKSRSPSYLMPGRIYDISLLVNFAKTPRNSDIGKVVFSLSLQDATGETIAQSVRTVPYLSRTPYFTVLQDIATFSYELLGIPGYPLTQEVYTSIMDSYVEPVGHPSSDTISVVLSTAAVDLYAVHLVIAPKMNVLTSFFYYYPWISYLSCTLILTVSLLWLIAVYFAMLYAFKKLSNNFSSDGDIISNHAEFDRRFERRRNFAENDFARTNPSATAGSFQPVAMTSHDELSTTNQLEADEELSRWYASLDEGDEKQDTPENTVRNASVIEEDTSDVTNSSSGMRQRRGFRVPNVVAPISS